MTYAYAIKPYRASQHCGDRCGVFVDGEEVLVYLIDGLGHGEEAECAALTAHDYLSRQRPWDLHELFAGCNQALIGTRGVSMGLARTRRCESSVSYFAVGNTRGALVGMCDRYLPCAQGVVGSGNLAISPRTYRFARRQALALWSDGMAQTLPFARYRREVSRISDNLAQRMLDDLADEDDDASIVLYRK